MRLIVRLRYPDGFVRDQESATAPVAGDVIVEQCGSYLVLGRRISYELVPDGKTPGPYGPTLEEATVVELDLGDLRTMGHLEEGSMRDEGDDDE